MDEQLLKVLRQLEKHLANAAPTVRPDMRRTLPGGRAAKDTTKVSAKATQELIDVTTALKTSFNKLDKVLQTTIKRVTGLNRAIGPKVKTQPTDDVQPRVEPVILGPVSPKVQPIPAQSAATPTPPPVPQPAAANLGITPNVLAKLGKGFSGITAAGGILRGSFLGLSPSAVGVGTALWGLYDLLRGPGLQVFNDIFRLQARGISAQENLVDFYIQAAKAGMSLEEYTRLLDENRAVVARFGSFKEFNRQLDAAAPALGGLGVFGESARQLGATMATSSTLLGIPQAQLGSVMEQQVKVFGELRKSVALTADGFKELISDLTANENVQANLLGMAPAQRAARLQELLQVRALGEQLGLTREQSARLADAMLAQRRATASERFKAMGQVRQAGALIGMDANSVEELARLAVQKNLRGEDAARLRQLAATYQAGLEEMQNSASLATQNIAEQLQANAPAFLSRIAEESGKAQLTVDSGPVLNRDFGTATGQFGQAVGHFAAAVSGFTRSPLYEALKDIGTIFGGLATFALAKRVVTGLKATSPKATAQASAAASAATSKSISSFISNATSTLSKGLQGLGPVLGKGITATAGTVTATGSKTASTMSSFLSNVSSSLMGGVKNLGTAVSKGFASVASTFSKGSSLLQGIGGVFSSRLKDISTGAARSLMGGLKGIGGAVDRGLDATAAAFSKGPRLFQGIGNVFSSGLKGISANLVTGARALGTTGTKAITSAMGALGGIFKTGGPLAFIFSAAEEAFTGELAAALGLGDGIFGRVLGTVIAGFNGIFTGISRLFDDSLNWLFEGLGINFRVNTTKVFDLITSVLVDGGKLVLSKFIKAAAKLIEAVTGIFGLDAPFVKSLRDTAAGIDESLAESAKIRQELWNTEGATLRSIGEKNLKAEKALADKAQVQAERITISASKVVHGMDSLVGSALTTVEQAQAQVKPAQPAQPQVAVPAIPVPMIRPVVTPPPVNTSSEPKSEQAPQIPSNLTVGGMTEVLTVLQQQLDVAKQLLTVLMEKQDQDPAVRLRPVLPSTVDLTGSLHK